MYSTVPLPMNCVDPSYGATFGTYCASALVKAKLVSFYDQNASGAQPCALSSFQASIMPVYTLLTPGVGYTSKYTGVSSYPLVNYYVVPFLRPSG